MDRSRCPGIVVAALRGGSGKTLFSVGIIAALRNRGIQIAPFKKGPDYIDAGWLALAAGRPCYNLDTFLIDSHFITESFQLHTQSADAAVIEGNRGLYDCINTEGLTSTAELAKLLALPVILCLDATKTTRTMAAVVMGCTHFDPQLHIRGLIFNHVAGARHEKILRDSIQHHCGIPVLGAMPKLRQQLFPERHMGLVPTYEHQWAQDAAGAIADLAEKHLDMAAIVDIATRPTRTPSDKPIVAIEVSPPAHDPAPDSPTCASRGRRPVIGIIRDSAFQFYYPENLEALVQAGADVVITSPLFEDNLPSVDALYIGGGFPETHAARLAKNVTYREQLRSLAEAGLPIYAECGGLMFLGEALELDEGSFAMTGVLPIRFGFCKRPQGHGYATVRVTHPNPFYDIGQTLKGHEFHYSKVLGQCDADHMAFEMVRGAGIMGGRDGMCRHNVLATYLHIHALGTPQWAPALVASARRFKQQKASVCRTIATSRPATTGPQTRLN